MADVTGKESDYGKLCRDCRHYRHKRHFLAGVEFEHGCARKVSLVTGSAKEVDAESERDNFLETFCGPSGQFFAPKIQEKLDVY
jgi:hypothetical protein